MNSLKLIWCKLEDKMDKLTHINDDGYAKMVDVSQKNQTRRFAKAVGEIHMKNKTLELIKNNEIKKGDVLSVAQIAGIMATKNTQFTIPMCHSIALESSDIKFQLFDDYIKCFCLVSCTGKTGVEMEAIVGVSTCLSTIYDMCKAVDKDMRITNIFLVEKIGGKSGHYIRKDKN